MWQKRPHWGRSYLEFSREGSIIGLRLKLDMLAELTVIEIHSLEIGEEIQPHDHQFTVGQELVCHLLVGQQIDEVTDNGPVDVLLHYIIGTVYHHVEVQAKVCNTSCDYNSCNFKLTLWSTKIRISSHPKSLFTRKTNLHLNYWSNSIKQSKIFKSTCMLWNWLYKIYGNFQHGVLH